MERGLVSMERGLVSMERGLVSMERGLVSTPLGPSCLTHVRAAINDSLATSA